jgi:hypothetical protein
MQPGPDDPYGQQPPPPWDAQPPPPPQPYGEQPPPYGNQPPQYGTQPPQYGTQPPQYGTQPPQYGTQPPQYGNEPPGYGTQPPPYGQFGQQPFYGPPPSNTQGLVGMILGIVAIPLLCCLYLGIPVGIAAAVLGFLGKQKADAGLATNRGQALAGIICGAAAAGLGLVLLVLNLVFQTADLTEYYR